MAAAVNWPIAPDLTRIDDLGYLRAIERGNSSLSPEDRA